MAVIKSFNKDFCIWLQQSSGVNLEICMEKFRVQLSESKPPITLVDLMTSLLKDCRVVVNHMSSNLVKSYRRRRRHRSKKREKLYRHESTLLIKVAKAVKRKKKSLQDRYEELFGSKTPPPPVIKKSESDSEENLKPSRIMPVQRSIRSRLQFAGDDNDDIIDLTHDLVNVEEKHEIVDYIYEKPCPKSHKKNMIIIGDKRKIHKIKKTAHNDKFTNSVKLKPHITTQFNENLSETSYVLDNEDDIIQVNIEAESEFPLREIKSEENLPSKTTTETIVPKCVFKDNEDSKIEILEKDLSLAEEENKNKKKNVISSEISESSAVIFANLDVDLSKLKNEIFSTVPEINSVTKSEKINELEYIPYPFQHVKKELSEIDSDKCSLEIDENTNLIRDITHNSSHISPHETNINSLEKEFSIMTEMGSVDVKVKLEEPFQNVPPNIQKPVQGTESTLIESSVNPKISLKPLHTLTRQSESNSDMIPQSNNEFNLIIAPLTNNTTQTSVISENSRETLSDESYQIKEAIDSSHPLRHIAESIICMMKEFEKYNSSIADAEKFTHQYVKNGIKVTAHQQLVQNQNHILSGAICHFKTFDFQSHKCFKELERITERVAHETKVLASPFDFNVFGKIFAMCYKASMFPNIPQLIPNNIETQCQRIQDTTVPVHIEQYTVNNVRTYKKPAKEATVPGNAEIYIPNNVRTCEKQTEEIRPNSSEQYMPNHKGILGKQIKETTRSVCTEQYNRDPHMMSFDHAVNNEHVDTFNNPGMQHFYSGYGNTANASSINTFPKNSQRHSEPKKQINMTNNNLGTYNTNIPSYSPLLENSLNKSAHSPLIKKLLRNNHQAESGNNTGYSYSNIAGSTPTENFNECNNKIRNYQCQIKKSGYHNVHVAPSSVHPYYDGRSKYINSFHHQLQYGKQNPQAYQQKLQYQSKVIPPSCEQSMQYMAASKTMLHSSTSSVDIQGYNQYWGHESACQSVPAAVSMTMGPPDDSRSVSRDSGFMSPTYNAACPAPDVTSGKCKICRSTTVLTCTQCFAAFYCGALCQNIDWPSHQQVCLPVTASATYPSI